MADPFVIAALPCGPGTLALCPLPGRDGGFAPDLAQIVGFAPDLVVSLTETAEMADLGAAGLPQALARAGIGWRHFPVADFGTPPPGADWCGVATEAQGALARGGRVLVHCRGGLGRSGMAVLRLMIEAGEDPDAALARLRAIRPGAVETAAQEHWARARSGATP